MAIKYIDGPRLVRAMVDGARWVASKRLHLNEINVFPVPDGDTGTNLTLTLMAAANAARGAPGRSIGEVASAVSRGVLIGARGNAGIILSQFLRDFAREVQGVEKLYPVGFSRALSNSVGGAYEAMEEPVEGTILTVISESVERAKRCVEEGETDFVRILEAMRDGAGESLASTPELLPVLKEAGVVDAGGEGFLDLLEGMLRSVRGDDLGDELLTPSPVGAEPPPRLSEQDLVYRYCVEFLLDGPNVDPANVRAAFQGLGGSLIVVGGPGLVRVHVHTNEPEVVVNAGAKLGETRDEKIDDMRAQHREMIRAVLAQGESGTESKGGEEELSVHPARLGAQRGARVVRIVTDSTADLPKKLADELGIVVIPLTVSFGDASYRDGVDLTAEEFFGRLAASTELPTTSQPSRGAFVQAYEHLSWETKIVLSVHISSSMSGTLQVARAASRETEGLTVCVIDSGLVSAPLGMVAVEAARAAREGRELSELRSFVSELCGRARVFFTVETMEYLVKGGRVGRAKGWAGRLTGIRPILTIEDGVIEPVARTRGQDRILSRLVELAEEDLEGCTGGVLGILHAQREEIVEPVEAAFRDRFGFDSVCVFELGSIVGTHAGPGTWGVSYFRAQGADGSAH